MKSILEEMEEIGADGVDFVPIDSEVRILSNGHKIADVLFNGTVYKSYTIDDIRKGVACPKSCRIYWKGNWKGNLFLKHYIAETDDYLMKFGEALNKLLKGSKLTRQGWNGKNQFIYYVPQGSYKPCTEIAEQLVNEQGLVDYAPYIAFKTVQNQVVPWTPSISDVLAEDWMVV